MMYNEFYTEDLTEILHVKEVETHCSTSKRT